MAVSEQRVVPLPEGNVHFGFRVVVIVLKVKSSWNNARDRIQIVVKPDGFAGDVRGSAKLALPQPFADERCTRRPELIFFFLGVTPDDRVYAKQREKCRGNQVAVQPFR